jgi:hypothetical protein
MNFYQYTRLVAIGVLFTLISACGGGGGGGGSGSSTNSTPEDNSTVPQNYVSQNIAANAISFGIQIIPGGGNVNTPYVSVDICKPGTSSCQTINNILLDTGSTGLRIFASNLETLQLPSQTQNNAPILECASFISGVTWGSVKLADVKLSAEIARSIPIQVIADPLYSSVPAYCSNGLPVLQTASSLRANGILGVGLFVVDGQQYFTCSSNQTTNCTSITLQANSQVQNPVASFPVNNNGVVLQTDKVSSTGAASATGTLYFGIDTQANNSSSGTNVIPTNTSGLFTTVFNGTTFTRSFIDSGSNGLYFPAGNLSTTLKPCTSNISFYCPATNQSYSATINLKNNQTGSIAFSIANAESLSLPNNYAQPALGGALQGLFDWGLPFFYGKNIYIGITGKSSNAGTGPLYAYKIN